MARIETGGALTAGVLLAMACGGNVELPAGSGGEAGSITAGTGTGGAGTGGGGPTCGPDCWTCCNDPRCPEVEPDTGDDCSYEEADGQIRCAYVREDGCLYTAFCDPGNWSYSLRLEPMDCPGVCPSDSPDYAPAPCLDVGKKCPYGPPEQCWELTCEENHYWNNSIPCP